MNLADKELIAEFVVESQEGLAKVENQMLAIEAAGADVDIDLVNAVFRTMHSIKGAAGFLGLDRIETLAHSLEEILNLLRNREVIPTSELVTTVLRAADFITGLVDAVESSNDADVAPYVVELQRFRPGATKVELSQTEYPPAIAGRDGELAMEIPTLSDTVQEFLVECHENLDDMERHLMELEESPTSEPLLRNVFRTMHTIKGGAGFLGLEALEQLAHVAENLLSQLRDGERPLTPSVASVLLMTVDKCREGLRLVESSARDAAFEPQSIIELLSNLEQSQSDVSDETTVLQVPSESIADMHADGTALAAPPASSPAPPTDASNQFPTATLHPTTDGVTCDKNPPSLGDSTIRVDVALLDKLMTRVGELVLARNQILQYTSNLDDSSFVSTAQRLNLITTELQESVMKTRMQPIGNVWAKFPRVVRDLASQLGKQVRIELEGKETELDKTIIEAIKDPLTHLVRNAVDHGIEMPEVRRAAGKDAEGQLYLRAFHEGGQVNIEISDDGAGLNIDRIRRKAIERGLVGADQAPRMTDREAAQLVLQPGFSTAEKVTSVSGRGVGMDVVKTNIERIGGMIDLSSQLGKGTTVKIKIPLTLAIIPALVVTNDGDRYAIPQASLLELVRLEAEQACREIEFVHGTPVYRLRGKLLPLVHLSKTLGLTKNQEHDPGRSSRGTSPEHLNIDFVLARGRHLAWKSRLRDFLDGKGAMDEQEATSPRACALGRWLYSEGLRDFGHLPGVQRLERTHSEMHAAVGKVVQHKRSGNLSGAEESLREVDSLAHKIVAQLDELKETANGGNAVSIVVLRANDRQFGLVVDKINDTEEIVVKPLSRQLKNISEYAGATIMGDGTVALILDVMGLATAAGLVGESREQTIAAIPSGEPKCSDESQSLLIVDLGDKRRFAMPTSLVSRLEKVPRSSIEYAGGREVIQYRGTVMPLVRLAQVLDSTVTNDDPEELQIVVYAEEGNSYGLVVNRIVDAVETELRFNAQKQGNDNLLGTAVIEERVTDVLDLRTVARQASSTHQPFTSYSS